MTNSSNPLPRAGGFFVARRPTHDLVHTVCSAIALALFVAGGFLVLVGVS